MNEGRTKATGFVNAPPPLTALDVSILFRGLLGGEKEPANFIVPAFRHWFDDTFTPIAGQVNTLTNGEKAERDQKWLDRCVGEGFALQKTSHEGHFISAKDAWAIIKRIEEGRGRPKSEWGAYAWSGAEAIEQGVASEATVPSTVDGLTRDEHMDQSWVDDQVKDERERFSGKGSYYVLRGNIKRALKETGHPVVTSCEWYEGDFGLGGGNLSPVMGQPAGKAVGGHMFALIGWIAYKGQDCLVAANSWGSDWGWHGLFLIPTTGVIDRLGHGYVHIDKDKATLAELLARYDGKNVKRVHSPEHYRCEQGVLRKFQDEIVWWSFGNRFGMGVYDIPEEDFEAIPKGADMRIEDAPFAELVRQIRQYCGQL